MDDKIIPGHKGNGYLKPQQPGAPGRPGAGRPRNHFREMIREIADQDKEVKVVMEGYLVDEAGDPVGNPVKVLVKIPAVSAIVMKAFKQAAKGNHNARKWLVEAGYGKTLNFGDDPDSPQGGGFVLVLPPNER